MDENNTPKKAGFERIIALLANVGTILLIVAPLAITWLSSAPVTIEEEQSPSTLPPYLSTTLVDATNALRTEKQASDRLGDTLRDLSQKLLRVNAVQRITLTNRSNSTVRELSARVPNVWKAEFYAVQCNACTQAETQSILALCKLDTFSNHVVIGPIPKLHPRSSIVVSIFGDFGIGFEQSSASYSDGDARLIKSEKVEGLAAVIAKLGPYGFLVLVVLFTGLQILNRAKWSRKGGS